MVAAIDDKKSTYKSKIDVTQSAGWVGEFIDFISAEELDSTPTCVLEMTQNHLMVGSSPRGFWNPEYHFIVISPRSSVTQSCSIW